MPFGLRQLLERITQWYARHYRLVLCARFGEGIKVSQPRHLVISGPGVELGNHLRIDPAPDAQIHLSCWPYLPATQPQPGIRLGDYCTLSPGVRLIAAERIEAGHSCMFAGSVYVTDADWHERYHRVFPPGKTAPVVLGNNVWLAEGVIVLKGVSIGDNSIVGAGAVVVSSLPANVVAAGNPATVVSTLDPEQPSTDRKALFESLDYDNYERDFWRQRSRGNSFTRWLLGALWPAFRRSTRESKRQSKRNGL